MEQEIREFVSNLKTKYRIMPYVYNDDSSFVPGNPVYYSGPYWDEDEVTLAINSLLGGTWISAGENVREFEKQFSRRINQNYGVMVNSGSSANLVMIAALKKYFKWEDNDEIIVSVVGFPTTVAPIIQNNLKAKFVDIEMETLNFDLNQIERIVSDKTRAIFLSPVLGNPPNIRHLEFICNKFNLQLILDSCDTLGTLWEGKHLNEFAIASSFSYYPAHPISTIEGGMVTSNNKDIIDLARSFATWGRGCFCQSTQNLLPNGMCKKRFSKWLPNYDGIVDHKYVFENMGYNLKPTDMQGAIGLAQIKKLDEIIRKRKLSREVITKYFSKLDVSFPKVLVGADVSWFGTPIICKNKEQKNKLVSYLEKNRIQTRNYFAGNILLHPGFEHLDDFRKYPNANLVLEQIFFVGAAPHYGENIFSYIKEVVDAYS